MADTTDRTDETIVVDEAADDATGQALRVAGRGKAKGLELQRYFTRPGSHPYDEIEWELRDAVIKNWRDGSTSFEQLGVEFPTSWSMNATTIVAQKYFRGQLGSPERERSVRQMIDRVADTITGWGTEYGYFADDESAEVFNAELKHLLVNQKAAFNSPVWFNVGVEKEPQCSACQPWNALVSTPQGFVPIGEIVDRDLVGMEVYDADGVTRVVATKNNGTKRVYRVLLRNGSFIEATGDHVVRAVNERRTPPAWVEVDDLRPGMRLHLQPHRRNAYLGVPDERQVSEAALAGWLQADGFVGQYDHGTNRSLTVEFQVANVEEEAWVKQHLDVVFPDVHRNVSGVEGLPEYHKIRLYGEVLRDFVERYGLLNRREAIRVPAQLWSAPGDVVAAYLRSVFQADGFVTSDGRRVGFSVISEQWTEDVQLLLLRLGIYSRRRRHREPRENRSDMWTVDVGQLSERRRFAELVGFVDAVKTDRLTRSIGRDGKQCPDLREEEIVDIIDLGEMPVYDIQTESGHYLSNSIVVHNCFILAVEDKMSSILNWYVEEGQIFKGGSGAGINLSSIRSSKETLKGGGEASGPVSFMRGADASAGTIKSGGKTRRAAKMVILNVDHPDIEEFIWTKAKEEKKIRVLREAGFDMDLDSPDYASVQYQNANNSVRVTDEFMRAHEADEDYDLRAVTTGEVLERRSAREIMRQFAAAAWECADPGMQFDTTINDWHTAPESGRINGSNPCFTAETLVGTEHGPVRIETLAKDDAAGNALPRVWAYDAAAGRWVLAGVNRAWQTKLTTDLVTVETRGGLSVRCTPDHRFLTATGEWVAAADLAVGTALRASGSGTDLRTDEVVAVTETPSDVPEAVFDLTVEGLHNFAVHTSSGAAVCAHNCSEYMHLDNSACNLASLNLKKFYDYEAGRFDVEAFKRAVEVIFLAQEIVVTPSSYPTDKIGENARAFRELGLGYANLGGLLMSIGLPYDSDEGRAWSGAITALMTGHAYRTSAEMAQVQGPFDGYKKNESAMLRVIGKHRAAVDEIDPRPLQKDLLDAARTAWDEALELGGRHGYRNSQASVLAPTGTIGLMMDCDTTGIEPDLGLVKTKKLVGGGSMAIVNQTVPQALRHLGYAEEQVEAIVAYIDEHKTIHGSPALRPEHTEVFQCAMGDDAIHYMGHVKMMAAAQPFLSGAISKTVNLPEEATVEDIEQLHVDAWKMGIKAIAIYRDNCKVAQPLSVTKKADAAVTATAAGAAPVSGMVRRKLPKKRPSQTISFQVAEAKGYLTTGEYPGDGLGEVFVKLGKQGSTLSGLLDAFAISMSLGLQYGVPLEAYVSKFMNMRFEPAGMTDDPEIRFATSIVDYMARKIAIEYLPYDKREQLGIFTLEERTAALDAQEAEPAVPPAPTAASVQASTELPTFEGSSVPVDHDAPLCFSCGVKMKRAGSCHVCESCGSTSGCS